MEFLIFLNKFDMDNDKLIKKISAFSKNPSFKKENDFIFLKADSINRTKILEMHEIKELIELKTFWKELNFKEMRGDCLMAVKKYKTYIIKTNFLNKIPLSAKSIYKHINPYLKHEGFLVSEDMHEVVINLEFKKEKNKIFYRVGLIENNTKNKIKVDTTNLAVLIEEPRLVEEISDFIRACYIFRIKLFILTKNKLAVEKLLDKAKKITKGIIYDKFIITIISSIPKEYRTIGFTKHAFDNESNLMNLLLQKEEKFCLVFGNDIYGLSQELRDNMNYCFRLTPEMKKPLKGNQALSYVLGLYVCMNIKPI